ncbi:MAG: class I SAM-dependent methyltransferase [Bacteroidales bacterium]|nr:class I SAM-dependent methyltransferase [Bacteroidales bacterium]
MKFSKEINQYISGERFSAGLDIHFSKEKYPDRTRIDKIIEITKNKRVIHIGCADHLPLIEQKIRNRKWLHGLLNESTAECIGLDINKEVVKFINEKLRINNVYYPDKNAYNLILSDEKHWDYIVLGEIIEHVDNPVAFLQELKERYKNKVDHIIITAPNVFNLLTVKDILNNLENINTDHRYWFSPFTLTKIVSIAGYFSPEICFAERIKLPMPKAIVRRVKKLLGMPLYFNANCFSNILLIADF